VGWLGRKPFHEREKMVKIEGDNCTKNVALGFELIITLIERFALNFVKKRNGG